MTISMILFINVLILFFVLLIGYQLFLAYFRKIIEGLDNNTQTTTSPTSYTNYNINDPNNALILAQQNAGNISFIKSRIDDLANIKKEVEDISGNVAQLTSQVNQLVQSQSDYATQNLPSTPPTITGT